MNTPVNIVIPMAGLGSRFSKFGYDKPKPLIEINNLPFFYYSASSVVHFFNVKKLIFVGLKAHNKDKVLENAILHYFPNAIIKLLDETPPGAVLTSREAIELIDNDYPVVFNDCDHMFYSEELRIAQNEFSSFDGFLLTFYSNNPAYSYCLKDKNGSITGTVEKKVASFEAIAGVYGFKNIELFDKASKDYLSKCEYSEYFLSGVYNMDSIKNVKSYNADFNVSFGTVDEFLRVKDSRLFYFYKGEVLCNTL